ncbi:MAG: hypothetical protein P8Y71_05490 [Pseudolabrys sp.]
MASEDQDLLRLNALVDGELPPAERAELAARLAVERDLAHGYATLARLKAAIGESAEDMPDIALPTTAARRRRWPKVTAAVAGLAAVLAIGFFVAHGYRSAQEADEAPNESPTAITLASLPAGTTIPRLDTAGLKLVSLHLDPGHVPLFTAHYRGPHGCRLDLRAWPVGEPPLPLAGSSRYRWTVGDLTYELVAHGMPAQRFNIVAGASELQTRLNADHNRINRRLREARSGVAPPCTG